MIATSAPANKQSVAVRNVCPRCNSDEFVSRLPAGWYMCGGCRETFDQDTFAGVREHELTKHTIVYESTPRKVKKSGYGRNRKRPGLRFNEERAREELTSWLFGPVIGAIFSGLMMYFATDPIVALLFFMLLVGAVGKISYILRKADELRTLGRIFGSDD